MSYVIRVIFIYDDTILLFFSKKEVHYKNIDKRFVLKIIKNFTKQMDLLLDALKTLTTPSHSLSSIIWSGIQNSSSQNLLSFCSRSGFILYTCLFRHWYAKLVTGIFFLFTHGNNIVNCMLFFQINLIFAMIFD